ncbi:UNVERIFIED_CONTAM: Na+/H+ exchanger NHE3 [Hammondia hammondi]|eukprot:XP_008884795.1 Na+/H+ exchanger NHE3 [Hammondia hammondi]
MSFLLGRGSENAQKTDGQKGDSVSPSSPETRDASSPSPSPAAAAQDAPPPAGMSLGASEKASSSGTKGEASGAQKDPTKTQTAATRPEPESPPTPATPPAANSKGHFFFGVDRPDRGKGEAGGVEREGGEKGSKSREEPPPPVFRVSSTSPSNAAVFVPAVFQQNSGEGNHVTLTIPLEVLPSLAAAGETATPPPDEKLASQGSDKERLTLSSLQWLPARESGAREREGETSVLHVGEKRRRGVHAQVGASGDEAPETSPASLEELSSNEREMVLSAGLLTLLLVLSVSLVLSHVSRKCHLRWLQMPVAATLLGLLVGAVLKFGLQVQGPILGSVLAMNEDVFFVMLLPPIIFEGGLSLSEGSLSKPFMRNFGAIMWLACFCTILSFCWVGTLMFFGGVLGLSMFLTVRQAFAFGALISSTDPVSVLALFKELHAKKLIHVLVFGESLLNDAISIVLYRTIASEDTASVGSAILAFFLTFFVSLVIGLAVGLFCALTYKYMDLHKEENQTLESALLLLFPWMAYLVADGLGYSGIVAICFCGVTIGKYAVPNLSASARTTSRSVFNSFSLLAETVVFAFLGLAVFSFDQPLHDELAVGLYVLGFVATFSARAISVFVTCTLINLFRTNAKITPQQQLALVLCGLRGAIAFALSERARRDFGGKEGAALLSLTLFLALFTILVLGPSLVFILDRLGIFEKHVPHRSSSPLEGSRVGRLDSDVELMRTSSQSTADFSLPGFSSARRRDCIHDSAVDAQRQSARTSSLPGFPGEKRESGLSWDDLRRSLGVHTPEGLRRQQGERGAREVAMTALPPEGRQASRLRAEASGETEERKPSGRVSARRGAKGGDTDDEDAAGFSAPGLERDEMRGQERREDERSREGARGRGERETGLEDPFTEEDFDDVRVALPNAPRASGLRSDSEDQEFHSEEESWTEHIEPFSATPESLPVVVGRGDARRDSISEEMRVRGPEKACAQGYEMQNGWQTNGRENGVENEADARESIVGKRQVL